MEKQQTNPLMDASPAPNSAPCASRRSIPGDNHAEDHRTIGNEVHSEKRRLVERGRGGWRLRLNQACSKNTQLTNAADER